MFVTNPIGIIGEKEATEMLKKKRLRILEHNWRMGHLEVDIIAENKKEIIFVEVKARTSTFADKTPEEYVDEIKKKRIIAAANAYIKQNNITKSPRFDIIGVLIHPETKKIIQINHIENAFSPTLRSTHLSSYSGTLKWGHRKRIIGK